VCRLRAIEIILSSFALMAAFKAIAFEQPTAEERLKAIGPTDALPRAFTIAQRSCKNTFPRHTFRMSFSTLFEVNFPTVFDVLVRSRE
jgi:hypothetical protein